jgi:large subunit ribosomal protein L30
MAAEKVEPKAKPRTDKVKSEKSGGAGTVRIEFYRSAISTPEKHKAIVRGLGLTKLNQVVERPDSPSIRGMVAKVPHLLRLVK